MLTAEAMHGIQAELGKMLAPSQVLVGGSYAWGGATEKSDLDIYVISSWKESWKIWLRKKKLKEWKQKYAGVWISIMVVPRFFYRHGWYYVLGKSLGGGTHKSGFHAPTIFKNAIKLSAFYGLKYQNGGGDHWRLKAGKQLKVAWAVAENNFSNDIFAENDFNYDWSQSELFYVAESNPQFWKFSWRNYFLYNSRFLPKGNFTFLFLNPDKHIKNKIFACLNSGSISEGCIAELKKIVFPVLMI